MKQKLIELKRKKKRSEGAAVTVSKLDNWLVRQKGVKGENEVEDWREGKERKNKKSKERVEPTL